MTKRDLFVMWIGAAVAVAVAVVTGSTNLPPTPAEMNLQPPEVPAHTPWVKPTRAVIHFQERDSLVSSNWTDSAVIYTDLKTGFYRIVIERD